MFEAGQRVLCVVWRWAKMGDGEFNLPLPRRGSLYVIANGAVAPPSHDCGRPLVSLATYPGWAFCGCAFAPINDKPTDISVFTEILKKAPAPGRPVPVTPRELMKPLVRAVDPTLLKRL